MFNAIGMYSNKSKGLFLILAPFVSLVAILITKVAINFFLAIGEENSGDANAFFNLMQMLLNFLALINVIGIIVLVPTGIYLMFRGGDKHGVKGNRLLADIGVRWLAKFIDGILYLVPAFLISWIIMVGSGSSTDTESSASAFWVVFLIIAIIQAYHLTVSGQTIGKKWLNIRIVDAETHKVGGFVKNVLLRTVLNAVFSFVPLYGIIDALFIFSADRRCIHDLLAGTIVVNANEIHTATGKMITQKFCTNCGMKAKPSAKFCVGCGTTLH